MAASGRWMDIPPEKEYEIHDKCYPCCSGGGYQKIKLYKDDVAFEATCPNPWPILCFLPAYAWVISCPLYFTLMGTKTIVRKPYTKLNGVEIDHYGGPCCDCCCDSKFFIKGLFAEHFGAPIASRTLRDGGVSPSASDCVMASKMPSRGMVPTHPAPPVSFLYSEMAPAIVGGPRAALAAGMPEPLGFGPAKRRTSRSSSS
mmetsp:Transcript_45161/g.118509  ORF Transcript_45161/g.118509 Transcript_45161/m.118509 type:complete len:201 (-) Transcript_45161:163-765(-)